MAKGKGMWGSHPNNRGPQILKPILYDPGGNFSAHTPGLPSSADYHQAPGLLQGIKNGLLIQGASVRGPRSPLDPFLAQLLATFKVRCIISAAATTVTSFPGRLTSATRWARCNPLPGPPPEPRGTVHVFEKED
jgi:hypothetical protein